MILLAKDDPEIKILKINKKEKSFCQSDLAPVSLVLGQNISIDRVAKCILFTNINT